MTNLLQLNVNSHVEKKNGLSYLSWAWAWSEALKADPYANFHVESFDGPDGTTLPYMAVGDTAMVWVRVSMLGMSRTCMLPVMNARNEPISIAGRTYKDKYGKDRIEKIDSFCVNTAIMRCMTKCLSLFGLGLYIYAGEDLPESVEEVKEVEVEKVDQQEKSNLELFADGIVEYLVLPKNKKELISYWNSNKDRLTRLNEVMPDRFESIKKMFQEAKAKMEETNG